MSCRLKAELAATCSTLGRLHKGEYLIEPECVESVKDLIRYLKRDDEGHEIRRYLGESKVLQNDLIHIIKSCPSEMSELFDVTLRLLINLTTPTMLFYGEEIPAEKVGRNIYLSLIGYGQEYKIAFCDVDFWNKICGKLTNLFETDWSERSADDGIQIERILMLLRNVLQVPADVESEKRPENDLTVHDRVLWALRQSQILELLLFVSSNKDEEQYFLNLLEIFSHILREQNPKVLAQCDMTRSAAEKNKDAEDLVRAREVEKKNRNQYLNMRNFNATFVMRGVKSLSDKDIVCHKSLEKVSTMDVDHQNKKQVKAKRNRVPVESERVERRSTFSVRLFLKEFCLEFLNGFNHLMNVVKNRLDSGKSLANDQTYYFWALKFFLDFTVASNSDVDLVKDLLSTESFHFVQTSMEDAFEHLKADKKKRVDWVKRIHLILKAYRSLLETLFWMDCSKSPLVRSVSREMKSQIFYVVEYREMTLQLLLRYDPTNFSVSYLRDLVETTHLFVKMLEDYSKQTKLVVQKVAKKKKSKKKTKEEPKKVETREEKWEKIQDDVYDTLCSESTFPELPPFDAALDIPIDDQKGRAMKKIQGLLHEGRIKDAIGLLRSSRQVWPENDYFGAEGMSVEDETAALKEICLADLGGIEGEEVAKEAPPQLEEEMEENEEDEEEGAGVRIVEQDFDIMDYKKRLVNKKVVEGCGILLKNYNKNSDHTNHCIIKLLHRIGWECCMPAMLYQASLFWTLLKIMKDKTKGYDEINTFTINLLRRFRKHATANPIVFLELLFWKENNVALQIQHGYEPYEEKQKPGKRTKKKKERKGGRSRKRKTSASESGFEAEHGEEVAGDWRREEMSEAEVSSNDEVVEENSPAKTPNGISRNLFENHSESENDELKGSKDSQRSVVPDKEAEENAAWRKLVESDDEMADTSNHQPTKNRQRIMDSSDEETGGGRNKETGTSQEGGKEGRESDHSINSQASNISSQKRGRKKSSLSSEDESDGSHHSRSKRVRYIGSDSDGGQLNSDGEEPVVMKDNKRRRRRLAVIDSDSDAEPLSPDESDIRSK